MTLKSKPATPSTTPAAATPAAWNWGTQLAQQQFAVGTEGTATLVRGFEAMRRIQAQATQQVVQRHAAANGQLGASPRPEDALAVQTELLRADLEDAARCWQQLLGEAVEVGNELLACSTRMINTEDVFAAAKLLHRPGD
ncbi:phasin family protein [Ramlibacter sp. PS3R-8]|uniref:phasin family protein n=1 Tax=Ramlibacter sp. PS3R-8 TaxID=3133437 RepID=UPI0030A9F5F2